jgi:hypothetical protein
MDHKEMCISLSLMRARGFSKFYNVFWEDYISCEMLYGPPPSVGMLLLGGPSSFPPENPRGILFNRIRGAGKVTRYSVRYVLTFTTPD